MRFMARIVLVTSVFLGSFMLAFAEVAASPQERELPCKKKILTVCSETQDGSPICEMIKAKREVNPERLASFLDHVRGLAGSVQDDLVCARLMGNQRFVDVGLDHDYRPVLANRYLRVSYEDEQMERFLSYLVELDKIKMRRFFREGEAAKMTFSGFVELAEADLFGQFHVRDVVVESIAIDWGEGRQTTHTPGELAEVASQALKKAYQELMQ